MKNKSLNYVMRKPIGISACLLGTNCRFDGGNCEIPDIHSWPHEWVPVCPEIAGGLPTPRVPAELTRSTNEIISNGSGVINRRREDVSHHFISGSKASLETMKSKGCETVILKSHSPSCGFGLVYDGHFTGKLIERNGIFAQMCVDAGLQVLSSEDMSTFLKVAP
ncbi:MAG: DUF523 domain-containing protein [Candidatus Marinimicrobia bacterium]|nr:DUF523 domain-containing protein [Candidatus Neomarinimicrobiota bacterium]